MGVRRDYGSQGEEVAPKQQRISQPSKGIRQMGMIRKESEKNHPARMQGSGRRGGGWFGRREREEERIGPPQGQRPSTKARALGSIPPRFSVPR